MKTYTIIFLSLILSCFSCKNDPKNDIKKQREFFVGLTEETTKILKNDIKSGKIHQQFCPMAFDGKGGYWLSDSNEIRNPYFGDVMLACGEVTQVLK